MMYEYVLEPGTYSFEIDSKGKLVIKTDMQIEMQNPPSRVQIYQPVPMLPLFTPQRQPIRSDTTEWQFGEMPENLTSFTKSEFLYLIPRYWTTICRQISNPNGTSLQQIRQEIFKIKSFFTMCSRLIITDDISYENALNITEDQVRRAIEKYF